MNQVNYPSDASEVLAVALGLRGGFIEVVQCFRCDLPLKDCAGHGSSPESEDNEAEEGR